jgi:hypothetical protein
VTCIDLKTKQNKTKKCLMEETIKAQLPQKVKIKVAN